MGNVNSKDLDIFDYESLKNEFGFTPEQIKRSYERFIDLDRRQCGTLAPTDFMRVPDFTRHPARDRMIRLIFSVYDEAHNLEWKYINEINFRHFLSAFSLFATPTTTHSTEVERKRNLKRQKVQLRFLSKFFDIQEKGYIIRKDVTEVVQLYMQNKIDSRKDINAGTNRSVDEANALSIELEKKRMVQIFFGTKVIIQYRDFEKTLCSIGFLEALDKEIAGSPII